MSEISLRTIKEEMRRAVIYCAVNFENYREVSAASESGELIKSIPDEKGMSKLSGKMAKYDLALFEVNSAPRSYIREKYNALGYADMAKKAYGQVSADYISAGIRKYGIVLEDGDAFSARNEANHKRKMEVLGASSDDSFPWVRAAILIIVLVSVIIGVFTDHDDRTDGEKKLDAYCASLGKSGCSDATRKIDEYGQ